MAWYAVFNGLGRIAWGAISDRAGRRTAIIAMMTAQGLVLLATYHGFINFGLATGLVVAASLIGFNYGGIFALFPAITADYFGNKEVGRNYGWVVTAYGAAGILGPLLAGVFKDAAAGGASPIGWMTPFLIAGIACLLGALLMMFTRAPSPSKAEIALKADATPQPRPEMARVRVRRRFHFRWRPPPGRSPAGTDRSRSEPSHRSPRPGCSLPADWWW